jgi:hypothetical protein
MTVSLNPRAKDILRETFILLFYKLQNCYINKSCTFLKYILAYTDEEHTSK